MAEGYFYPQQGGYGGNMGLDPASMRSRLAMGLMAQGTDSSPIRSKWQGAARLAQALVGGMMYRQGMQNDATNKASILGGAPAVPTGTGIPQFSPSPSPIGIAGSPAAIPPAFTQPNGQAGGATPGSPASMPPGQMVASNDPNFAPSFSDPSQASGPQAGGVSIPNFYSGGQTSQYPAPGEHAAQGGPLATLTSMGYSPVAAAGILGNFRQESGMNPAISGDGGTSIGLGQWHGDRAQALQQFASANNADWRDPQVQMAFTDREIKQNPQLFQALQSAQTPQQAADIFSAGFERPNPQYAMNDKREAYAAAALDPHMMVAGPGAPSAHGAPAQPQPPADDQGGGNPLAALAGMFGGGSSQQAFPTVPQPNKGDMAGYIQRMMAISMDENTSPYIREQAAHLAQMYMPYILPHAMEWRSNPGTNDQQGWNPITGLPVPGAFRPGPHPIEAVDAGTDLFGASHRGILDKLTGGFRPFGGAIPSGQPPLPGSAPGSQPPLPGAGAGAQPPAPGPTPEQPKEWSQGAPLAPDMDSKVQALASQFTAGTDPRAQQFVYQYAKALLQGNQQFIVAGTSAKSPLVEMAETVARQVDPDGMPQTRFDTIKQNADSSSPTSLGGQRMAAQTSIRHLGALAEASDFLDKQGQWGGSEMASHVQQWAARNAGVAGGAGGKLVTATQAYDAGLVPVLGEIDKLYKGGQATEGEINEMKANLQPTASPEARRAALTMLRGLLSDKVDVLQKTWHMGVGDHFGDLPIIDKQGRAALDYINKWGPSGQSPASGSASSKVPQAAVDRLKANPSEAAQFDEIFGAGAAAKALGK